MINDNILVNYKINKMLNLPILKKRKKLNEKIIIIIDFPILGGGASFFLNTIISYYSKFKNFIIIRNFNNIIQLTYNEKREIGRFNNFNELYNFLKTIDIEFIFINHFVEINIDFLNKLPNLNKNIYGITHDYNLLFKNPQPYFENFEKEEKNNINLNIFTKLYCQNIILKNYFSKYFNKQIIVSELPDYRYSKEKINTNNKTCNILLIGFIGKIKGGEVAKSFFRKLRNNQELSFFCAGRIFRKMKQKKYNSIEELNCILKEFKPNVILETSLWPETYSYTLTLSKIINVPIISIKKNFDSVVHNRLLDYNKKVIIEKTIKPQLFKNICLKMKQDYFYTIDNSICFPEEFNKLFLIPN